MDEKDFIEQEVEKLVLPGVLGRSRSYARLLEYLAACSAQGRAPKELEIASEVFGKGADFDPNQDSLVRVYVHNLRQKLDNYYFRAEFATSEKITIPKGEYRLAVISTADATPVSGRRRHTPPIWAVALFTAFVINTAAVVWPGRDSAEDVYDQVSRSSIWASFMDDDLPFLVVVGDYYIFAELDAFGSVERLVREFDVNSAEDLADRFVYEPDLMATYLDLDLTYLPQASAVAIKNLLRVVYRSDKSVRVTPMSELTVADLKNNHVIYVGYISALDKLMDFVFTSSGLELGETYDELLNVETGESYTSGAGIPRDGPRNYTDYGLLSTFPGPGGNQLMIVAGTRDAGLMHTAQAATTLANVEALEASLPGTLSDGSIALEALYEVKGFDRVSLDAVLVYTGTLNYQNIWGGEIP
ncbi:MAG: helix-turn-helix domain-containing protein [Gammaproteobacteria bacterium]